MIVRGRHLWLFLGALFLVRLQHFAECREVACFECSWTGSQELDEEKEEKLDDLIKEMASMSKPIDNPLVKPYLHSKVVPDKLLLQSQCKKCSLPNGKCVRWTFHLNNIVQNATFMCVQSVSDGELGIFEQTMPGGVLKRVSICNVDYCNDSKGEEIRPSLIMYIVLLLLVIADML